MISRLRAKALEKLRVSVTHRTPSSWDFTFEDGEPCLVVVTMKSGNAVAGYYGPKSHSGYGSQYRDLFLEERWTIISEDGTTRLEPTEQSLGIWVAADEIVSVERYGVDDEQVQELRGEES